MQQTSEEKLFALMVAAEEQHDNQRNDKNEPAPRTRYRCYHLCTHKGYRC